LLRPPSYSKSRASDLSSRTEVVDEIPPTGLLELYPSLPSTTTPLPITPTSCDQSETSVVKSNFLSPLHPSPKLLNPPTEPVPLLKPLELTSTVVMIKRLRRLLVTGRLSRTTRMVMIPNRNGLSRVKRRTSINSFPSWRAQSKRQSRLPMLVS